MKKLILVASMCVTWAGILGASDLAEAGLIGKVRAVDEETYTLVEDSGKWSRDSLDSRDGYAYDANGNLIEWAGYEPSGRLAQKWVYSFDGEGRQTRREKFDGDGFLIVRISFVHDAGGSRIAGITYTPSGMIIGEAAYEGDGALWYKSSFAYDARGNRIESIQFNADGSPGTRTVYAYDAKGNEVEKAEYYADGSPGAKLAYSYEFDDVGNWIAKTTSALMMDGGKTYAEPRSITVRAITYRP
jgi:hypothetical protein